MSNYFFADGTSQRGPFPKEELVAQGLRPQMLVWAEGMPNWVPASQVPELAPLFSAAPSPSIGNAPPYVQQAPGYPPAGSPAYPPPGGFATPGYQQPGYQQGGYVPQYGNGQMANRGDASSKKITVGLLAILLNGFGIHKFILGYTGAGVIYLLVSLVGGVITCGISTMVMSVIGFIEGIIYLTKTDDQFYQTYMVGRREWF